MIANITPGGPAERAGLRGPKIVNTRRGLFVVQKVDRSAADVIVGVDKEEIKTADDFLGYIETKRIGDKITLEIIRGGQKKFVSVTLGGTVPTSTRN